MKRNFLKVISLVLCFSLVFGFSALAADSGVSRVSAVVYGDSATQKGLCWYTDTEAKSTLKIKNILGIDITDTLEIAHTVEAFEGKFVQKAIISKLTPGNVYNYDIDGVTGRFFTDNGDSFFDGIIVGDVQASNKENFDKAAMTIKKAFDVMPTAEFYVTLGDFTNDSTNEEWDLYSESFAEINTKTTLVPVAGNHDSASGWFNNMFALDTTESVQTKNGVNYSFDYGNVHIAVVNTNDLIAISNAQLKWLENDLNSTTADFKIVMTHKAPYSMGKDIKWPDAQYLQQSLTAVCDRTGVDIVMSGHDHMYVRTEPLTGNALAAEGEGVTYILGGTPGSKRYEFRNFVADNFIPTEFFNTVVSQKTGYGNFFNGTDFNEKDEANIGGAFTTLSVRGGLLTLNTYIVSDADGSLKLIDTYSILKETGKNTATFTGDNTTSKAAYTAGIIPSFMSLAQYAFTVWLPKFFKALPKILAEYKATGTF